MRTLDFIVGRAIERVKNQGGFLLEEPCRSEELPRLKDLPDTPWWTQGCNGQTRVSVPYEADGGGTIVNAVVCMVDDMVYLWPRVMEAG